MVSQGCWFLFQHWFSEFQILISFLGKFGSKKSKLPVLTENWYIWYLKDADSYFNNSFMNFYIQIPFWANLDQKNKSYLSCLKVDIHGILSMLTLISTFVFLISIKKSIFGQIWAKNVKFVHFAWKLAHLLSWRCRFLF